MIYGVFHGDLHGGNLVVTPDGQRRALRPRHHRAPRREQQRLAFLRLMMTGAVNDIRGQLEAFRDLGALDADADLDEIARLLRVDEPVGDPTRMTGEELVARDPARPEGPARPGRAAAEAADALREGHAVLRRRDRRRWRPTSTCSRSWRASTATSRRTTPSASARDIGVDPRQATARPARRCAPRSGSRTASRRITPAEVLRRRETIRERLEKEGAG